VVRSRWECQVEPDGSLRLGGNQVQGLSREHVEGMLAERERQPFASLADFQARTRFTTEERRRLAELGALNAFAAHRRAALWETGKPLRQDELFRDEPATRSPLRPMDAAERLQADYAGQRLTTGPHPMALVRGQLPDLWRAADLPSARDGERIRIGGQVICRQRPGTAKGVCFVSLEDETGISNAIVTPQLFEEVRLTLTQEPFLVIEGIVQNRHRTIHVHARTLARLDYAGLQTAASHDFG
jgi:error-prone DNA polymerase